MGSKSKVLVIGFSQSGQLTRILDQICAPIEASTIEVTRATLISPDDYPFPWPFFRFFNTFPETVYEDGPTPKLTLLDGQKVEEETFDLVILGYQVWFLSPSLPMSGFMNGPDAKRLLTGRRVMTVIGCRNMWLMAQERMKKKLRALSAHHVDNVVLTDQGKTATTFLSTPIWVLSGNKGPWLGGLIPKAGVSEQGIKAASRFGTAIVDQLPDRLPSDNAPFLAGLGAVKVNNKLIQSEKAGQRSFAIWGNLLRKLGPPSANLRIFALCFFIIFLIILIFTVVPIVALIKTIIAPLTAKRQSRERLYYGEPSGE